jgi:RNA polymerase sigma factor (sigma-70 family)
MERRAASTDEDERQRLLEEVVELNIEMARGIARRFRGRGAEADDLEQVAYLGLVKAAHHYRLDADTPFIGFAIPTIRGEVKRYFRDCAWTVRIPRRLQELQGTIAAKLPELEQELNREPTPAEIAEHLGVEAAEVEQALAAKGCFNVLSTSSRMRTTAASTNWRRSRCCSRCWRISASGSAGSCSCASSRAGPSPRSATTSASARCRCRGSSARSSTTSATSSPLSQPPPSGGRHPVRRLAWGRF